MTEPLKIHIKVALYRLSSLYLEIYNKEKRKKKETRNKKRARKVHWKSFEGERGRAEWCIYFTISEKLKSTNKT